jgi:hypothetical protein
VAEGKVAYAAPVLAVPVLAVQVLVAETVRELLPTACIE